ncbi:MAG: hypothetical protein ABGX27_04580 [Desulfurobacteriaceae bacterium]
MKFLKLIIRLKNKSLELEKRKLLLLEKKYSELNEKLLKEEEALKNSKEFTPSDAFSLALLQELQHKKLKEIEKLRKYLDILSKVLEKQKERVAILNSEIKLLEKKIKRIEIENTKREDLLLERFINEVRSHSDSIYST